MPNAFIFAETFQLQNSFLKIEDKEQSVSELFKFIQRLKLKEANVYCIQIKLYEFIILFNTYN